MDFDARVLLPGYVIDALEFPRQQGLTLEFISQRSGIDLSNIADRTQPFTLNEGLRIGRVVADALKIPHYGLVLGGHAGLNCHGLASVLAMSQETYGDCLKVASRMGDTMFPPLVGEYFETKNAVGLRYFESMSLGHHTRFFHEYIMMNFVNILRFLLGEDRSAKYIAFPYEEPSYGEKYRRYLGCEVIFGVTHAEFVVERSMAEETLPLANSSVANQVEARLTQSALGDSHDQLQARIRAIIVKNMDEVPKVEEIAQKLGMHERTLRRQLSKQGTGFTALLEKIRHEVAVAQLIHSDKAVTEIAESMGFHDTSAFSKAFKRWAGKTPTEYRSEFRGF